MAVVDRELVSILVTEEKPADSSGKGQGPYKPVTRSSRPRVLQWLIVAASLVLNIGVVCGEQRRLDPNAFAGVAGSHGLKRYWFLGCTSRVKSICWHT